MQEFMQKYHLLYIRILSRYLNTCVTKRIYELFVSALDRKPLQKPYDGPYKLGTKAQTNISQLTLEL